MFTQYLASSCANLNHHFTLLMPFFSSLSQNTTMGNTPWPAPQDQAEGHASQEAATSLRDTPGRGKCREARLCPWLQMPTKAAFVPWWLSAWLRQNQQGLIPAALGNRMGQERIGWAAPTFCAPLTCTERSCVSKGPGLLRRLPS